MLAVTVRRFRNESSHWPSTEDIPTNSERVAICLALAYEVRIQLPLYNVGLAVLVGAIRVLTPLDTLQQILLLSSVFSSP
jgi:hypothetical protein